MAKILIKYLDDLSPSELKLRDLPRKPDGLYNLAFNEYGQEVKRAGYAEYNTDSIGAAHKITGMHRFYKQKTTDKEFLVAWNTGIYKLPSDVGHAATLIPGNEIHTQANAASDPNSAEANATTGWSDSGTTLTSVVTSPQTGTYCLKAVANDGTDDYVSYSFTAVIGAKYYVSIWAKRGEGTKQKIVGWQGVDSSPSEDIAAGDWAEYIYTVTASATTIEIRIYAAKTGGAANNEIYIDNVSIYELLTADSDTYFATFANHCYIANGEDGLQKYNGTYVRSVGITPPADAPAGNSPPATENLSEGDYKVCYTYVDEDGYESNASDSVTISATAGDKIALTDMVVSSDAKVTKHKIYRTIANGAIFYLDKEIDEATSADLTQSDNDLAFKSILHTDHNAPPDAPSLISKRRSRINLAVDDELWVSKNYDKTTGVRSVEYFPPTNYYPTGNGQKITGLKEQLITLPIFTEDSVERFIGTDNTNFELRNAFTPEGCIAKRSLVNCENFLVYLGFNGIFYFDGVTTGEFSRQLNEYIKTNINYSYAQLSCAIYYDNKYLICIPTGESAVPNVTIYYDFKTKTCGIYSFAFSCFCKFDKGGDNQRLFGGSNTIGRIYEIGGLTLTDYDETTGEDIAITAYDDIEPLDFGIPERYKQWYSIFIKIKTTLGTALAMYYTLDNGTETSANMVSRNDIAFVDGGDNADTITTEEGDFVAAGFKAEDVLVVTGTDNNNGNMTIVSVVAKTITLATGIVTTEEGDAILTKAKVLTANTTKWYRVCLGEGGNRARALKPRPYMSDKYAFTIMGLAFCFDPEPFAEEKE